MNKEIVGQIIRNFEERSRLTGIQAEFRERGGNSVLLLKVANPTERLFEILEQVQKDFATENSDGPLVTLLKKSSGRSPCRCGGGVFS